ncbi:hypothetical protein SO802_033743 [Lithocarpus litseifolius]|uniref:RNase H type-1 domain-containing protein n=1 Tax=Lithocarpus litseifolius TaxID=425828 RepID=A0AAW2BF82_9ROSI
MSKIGEEEERLRCPIRRISEEEERLKRGTNMGHGNLYIFKDRTRNPNVAKEILARAMECNHCACSHTATKKLTLRSIRWEKPNAGWMKLNTDGSSIGTLGLAGSGGVIRDEEGKWVIGYGRKIGSANSFLAELWALRDGLLLCLQSHAQAVVIEMDAKVIVDAFLTRITLMLLFLLLWMIVGNWLTRSLK